MKDFKCLRCDYRQGIHEVLEDEKGTFLTCVKCKCRNDVEVKEQEEATPAPKFKTNVNISIPKKYIPMIKEVDYEGRMDGYWLYLHEGYASDNGYGCQTVHAYTKKELMDQIRNITEEIK